jgi:hypothetical protein
MATWERALLVIVGTLLLLPATCSVAFTPMTIMSFDVTGVSDHRTVFSGMLFWISIGYIVALGGVRLLHASKRGSWSAPYPRWLSILTGTVLLLPGLAAAFAISELVVRSSTGQSTHDEGAIFLVVMAPLFIVPGVYILWRSRRPCSGTPRA